MNHPNFQVEIRELNVAYLVLAQKMLRCDRETAMYRLGIGKELADFIENLSSARLVRMAGNPVLIPRFRFDDERLARLMAGEGRDEMASTLHAAIIAADRSAEEETASGRSGERANEKQADHRRSTRHSPRN